MKRLARLLIRVGVVLCCAAGAAYASFDWIERHMIYPLDPTEVSPTQAGWPEGHSLRLDVAGGEAQVVVWHHPPTPGHPVVVYLHGNAGNLAARAARFRLMAARGLGVVAMGYRGGSGSSGTPSEPALTADALALWQWVETQPQLRGPRVIYGESLGTGVALALAAQLRARPTLSPTTGIVLEAPFQSIPALAHQAYGLPETVLTRIRSRWDNTTRAPDTRAPVLVLHGTADRVVPYAQGAAVFAALGSKDKTMVTLERTNHHAIWAQVPALRALWQFIDRLRI
ncbi:MAG: alpha/beta hydrolase [Paracoccaceae bacterium]